ncbi:iron ABC transporter permease [Apibacter sp. HY039]|uniref:iron ABC transporter permease n=1 Tax=Apibacter sp. HY039 TaxID=2501476 RepID=UPI000FEBA669|nr:iron ABC transporter permease [Apibacter sp. HY039]
MYRIIIFVAMFSKKFILLLSALGLLCLFLFFANLLSGFENIKFYDLFYTSEETKKLIVTYRLYKTLAVFFAGISLPVSGFLLQEFFKNPLAEPSILGISSGSALSVAFIIFSGVPALLFNFEWLSGWILILSSLVGSVSVSLLLLFIAKNMRDTSTFIIVGFLISAFCGSVIGALQFYSESEALKQYVVWSFGSFEGLSKVQIIVYGFCTCLGLLPAFLSIKNLTGFLLGNNYARILGINMTILKLLIITSICLLTGSTTAMLGPIVFIGIIIPHFCRLLWNPAALWEQMILNILCGTGFMLLISLIIVQTQLPVNILSSLIGIPTILFMIVKNKFKTYSF